MKLVPVASLLIAAPLAAQGHSLDQATNFDRQATDLGQQAPDLGRRDTDFGDKYDGPPPPQRIAVRGWGRTPLAGPSNDDTSVGGSNDPREYVDVKSTDKEVGFDDPTRVVRKVELAWPGILEESLNMREAAQRYELDLEDFDGIKAAIARVDKDFEGTALRETGFAIPVRHLEQLARRRPIQDTDVRHFVSELKYLRAQIAREAAEATHDTALRRRAIRIAVMLEAEYTGDFGVQLGDQSDADRSVQLAKKRLEVAIGYLGGSGVELGSSEAVYLGELRLALKRAQLKREAVELDSIQHPWV